MMSCKTFHLILIEPSLVCIIVTFHVLSYHSMLRQLVIRSIVCVSLGLDISREKGVEDKLQSKQQMAQ